MDQSLPEAGTSNKWGKYHLNKEQETETNAPGVGQDTVQAQEGGNPEKIYPSGFQEVRSFRHNGMSWGDKIKHLVMKPAFPAYRM